MTIARPTRPSIGDVTRVNSRLSCAARSAASQGQQRSIVLACKLAEMRHVAQRSGIQVSEPSRNLSGYRSKRARHSGARFAAPSVIPLR